MILKFIINYFHFVALGIVAFLSLLSPKWLTINGISPLWGIFWLLPISFQFGPLSGIKSGLILGLILDGINFSESTQIPALICLGYWWGILGRRGVSITLGKNLGFLSWMGSFLVGISLFVQIYLSHFFKGFSDTLLIYWGLRTIFAQAIITGILAPLICPIVMKYAKKSF